MRRSLLTSLATEVVDAARFEARRRNHRHVGGEHVLLALIGDGACEATRALKNLGAFPAQIAVEVEKRALWEPPLSTMNVAIRDDTRAIVDRAVEEAAALRHFYVCTQHLLLALLRDPRELAAGVLAQFGVTADLARAEVLRLLNLRLAPPQANPQFDPNANPLDAAEREFYLGLYRAAVAFYQPRIEKRMWVSLGTVRVWDAAELIQHTIDDQQRNERWLARLLRGTVFRLRDRRLRETAEQVQRQHSRTIAATYYHNAIYVSFAGGASHDYGIASTTVHELSHALWEKLSGKSFLAQWENLTTTAERERYFVFVEGFAEYCERILFLDFYPAAIRQSIRWTPPPGVYYQGLRAVEKLVAEFGPQIIPQIPTRWHKLPFEPEDLGP